MPNASPALPATPTIQTDFHILSFVPLKIRKAISRILTEMYDRPPGLSLSSISENASRIFITPSRKPARAAVHFLYNRANEKTCSVDSAFPPRWRLCRRPPGQLADYYRVETAGTPAISPDGRWVVFVRNTTVEAENQHHSELWISPSDGSTPAPA